MAARGRPTAEIVLSDEERETLERWARRPKSAHALACGAGSCWPRPRGASTATSPRSWASTRRRSASGERVSRASASTPARRARPGKPRTVSDADVERVIVVPGHNGRWEAADVEAAPKLGP